MRSMTADLTQLYEQFSPGARSHARALVPAQDVDDVVADAFTGVVAAIRRGGGPASAPRAYVHTAVTHAAYDHGRKARHLSLLADPEPPPAPPADSGFSESDEGAYVTRAYAALPVRWRMVLWRTEVEGMSAAQAGPLLGLSPNATAALAMRAREGLRVAWLDAHTGEAAPGCRAYVADLAAATRGKATRRRTDRLEAHQDGCASCRDLAGRLRYLNRNLGCYLGPAAAVAGLAAARHAAPAVKVHALARLLHIGHLTPVAAIATVSGALVVTAGGVAVAPHLGITVPGTSGPHAAVSASARPVAEPSYQPRHAKAAASALAPGAVSSGAPVAAAVGSSPVPIAPPVTVPLGLGAVAADPGGAVGGAVGGTVSDAATGAGRAVTGVTGAVGEAVPGPVGHSVRSLGQGLGDAVTGLVSGTVGAAQGLAPGIVPDPGPSPDPGSPGSPGIVPDPLASVLPSPLVSVLPSLPDLLGS
jgi:RNA polymerase sigma factor (sigma-70 family)